MALLNPRDELHQVTVAAYRASQSKQIITSEMVLVEFLNSFSKAGPHLRMAAARAVSSLRQDMRILVVPQSSRLFERAWVRYSDMADKGWSLTDCASFLIMEEFGLKAALTHDRDFVQAGFEALLRST